MNFTQALACTVHERINEFYKAFILTVHEQINEFYKSFNSHGFSHARKVCRRRSLQATLKTKSYQIYSQRQNTCDKMMKI